MAIADGSFAAWLSPAGLSEQTLTPDQLGVARAAYHFRQSCSDDYFSTRILSHFLLHAKTGLKVAQIARLLKLSRPTASRQQGRSSKETIQSAHHRMAGRAYGKLLPRYAGPIVEFILSQPEASRYDLLAFIERTWKVRVSTVALHRFLKKYGLDRASRAAVAQATSQPTAANLATASVATQPLGTPVIVPGEPVPEPPPPFSWQRRTTPAPSCCCPRP
jgi:transposase